VKVAKRLEAARLSRLTDACGWRPQVLTADDNVNPSIAFSPSFDGWSAAASPQRQHPQTETFVYNDEPVVSVSVYEARSGKASGPTANIPKQTPAAAAASDDSDSSDGEHFERRLSRYGIPYSGSASSLPPTVRGPHRARAGTLCVLRGPAAPQE
jgi:hypothetical protein